MLKDISDLEAGDQKVLGISCDFTKGERVVVTDLTKEHPNKTLWRFLLPMMLSVMFQQIYNIADSMIAGKFAGEDALAAVGASYPITVIFMAFAVGMNLGTSVIVSRLFGAGDRKGVKRAVTTAFAASGVLGIALTVFGCVGMQKHDGMDSHTGEYSGRWRVVSEDLCVRIVVPDALQCLYRCLYGTWRF